MTFPGQLSFGIFTCRVVYFRHQRTRAALFPQEDLERGYFDDFKELKDTAGKLWRSPDRLIPAEAVQPFPPIKVHWPKRQLHACPNSLHDNQQATAVAVLL